MITNYQDGSFQRRPGETIQEWYARWIAAREREAQCFNHRNR